VITGARQHDDDVATVRLSVAVDAMASERNATRLCEVALLAACEMSGAEGGEVVVLDDAGGPVSCAVIGEPPASGPRQVTRLVAAGVQLGAVSLWGDNLTDVPAPVLAILAAQLAQALATERLGRSAVAQRSRARRLARAVRALRDLDVEDRGLARLADESCTLVGGVGAILVSGASEQARIIAGTGLDPLAEQTLAGLVACELHRLCVQGRPWAGALPAASPLRELGVVGIGLVAVRGEEDHTSTLAVVTNHVGGMDAQDLEALQSLADYATATLGAAAMRGRIAALATVDPVTRFFNERYFVTRLEQETHRAIRGRESLSLVVLGLDGLRHLRREAGPGAANSFLEAFVDHIVFGLRATDVGCRIADDELAIILPASGGLDAFRIAERVRSECVRAGLLPAGVGLSVGVASFPDQAGNGEQLARFGRAALTQARRHGGDRTFLFDRQVASIIDDQDLRDHEATESLLATIVGVAAAVDDRHPTTHGHSQNVAYIGARIAQEMGLSLDRIEEVRLAGVLHDVGKIGVSDELLSRPGPLEPDEWEEMRQHPEIAFRMLSGAELGDVRTFVRFHHERLDGTGYPTGLVGDEIPLESRIIGVANALDAMIHDRPYRLAVPFRDAIREIRDAAGTQFCPEVVAALVRIVERDASELGTTAGADASD
jgi:diguanylate cyclase (GGDEF)-like protein